MISHSDEKLTKNTNPSFLSDHCNEPHKAIISWIGGNGSIEES